MINWTEKFPGSAEVMAPLSNVWHLAPSPHHHLLIASSSSSLSSSSLSWLSEQMSTVSGINKSDVSSVCQTPSSILGVIFIIVFFDCDLLLWWWWWWGWKQQCDEDENSNVMMMRMKITIWWWWWRWQDDVKEAVQSRAAGLARVAPNFRTTCKPSSSSLSLSSSSSSSSSSWV